MMILARLLLVASVAGACTSASLLASCSSAGSVPAAVRARGGVARDGFASRPAFVEVIVQGAGLNPADARLAARREAVLQAVGAFVLGRTEVVDERLEEDRVLSLSDGYVAEERVLREWKGDGGLHRVELWARVVDSRASEAQLREEGRALPVNKVPETVEDTVGIRASEALRYLDESMALSDYPLGIFAVDVTRVTAEEGASASKVTLDCTLRVDDERWMLFLSRLERALAALGAMDSSVSWRERSAGRRAVELASRQTVVGWMGPFPIEAKPGPWSGLRLPGPLDNAVVATDPSAEDRAVLLVESGRETCRAYTLPLAAFDAIAPSIAAAASRRARLHVALLDSTGERVASRVGTLDLNFSTGVLLLARVEDGVPRMLMAAHARHLDGASYSPHRPLQIVPAMGLQELLVRELELSVALTVRPEAAERAVSAQAWLEW